MPSVMSEPLALKPHSELPDPPVFLRSVARARIWTSAKQSKEPLLAADLLYEADNNVSLWKVSDDRELRRVAIAINESRDSLRETIDLLPITPSELTAAGIGFMPELGDSECPTAARLHYSAEIDTDARLRLLRKLIDANRELLRCTGGKMKRAVQLSIEDQCFIPVPDSKQCACGEQR